MSSGPPYAGHELLQMHLMLHADVPQLVQYRPESELNIQHVTPYVCRDCEHLVWMVFSSGSHSTGGGMRVDGRLVPWELTSTSHALTALPGTPRSLSALYGDEVWAQYPEIQVSKRLLGMPEWLGKHAGM